MQKIPFFSRRRFFQQKLSLLGQYLGENSYDEAFQLCQNIRRNSKTSVPADILYAGACSLFGLGHVHQAEEWVKVYGEAAKKNTAYHLYLTAYLSLHRKQTEEALLDWTSILQSDPSQTFADDLIERLRHSEKSVLEEINDPYYAKRYVPMDFLEYLSNKKAASKKSTSETFLFPGLPFKKIAFSFIILFVVANGIFFLAEEYPAILSFWKTKKEELPKAPRNITLFSAEQYGEEPPLFIYKKPREVIEIYEKARRQILARKVNQARLLLRHIELSNAGFEAKERSFLLRDSIPFMQLDEFHDPVSIKEVLAKPYLYQETQILWKGQLRLIKPKPTGLELELEVKKRHTSSVEKKLFKAEYFLSEKEKKELLPKLNVQNEIQVFGLFKGMDAGYPKVIIKRLIFNNH